MNTQCLTTKMISIFETEINVSQANLGENLERIYI
jgi:hypothetical protein